MNTQNSPAPPAVSLGTRFREALDLRPLTVADMARIPVFAALTAVLAQASIHLFGNAVPVTGQTLGVMLAGLILGPLRGALAMLVYLALGAAGLPIFANGAAGIGTFSLPSGGFLLSFPIAAFVIGLLTHRMRKLSPSVAFSACVVGGIGVVYLVGVPYMAWRLGLTAEEATAAGLVYVPGDLLKAALATYIAVGVYRAYPALADDRAKKTTA